MAGLSPYKAQFFDNNGDPLVGGKLYTYEAGTTTPLSTYSESTGASANTNPVVLNARGEADIWLKAASYKFVLKDADDVTLWTVDGVQGPSDPTEESANSVFSWVNSATGQLWQFSPSPSINALPKNVRWVLRCITAGDGTYAVGDYIDVTFSTVGNSCYGITGGALFCYYSQNGVLIVKDKAVGATNITLTASRWDLKCIAEF